MYERTHTHSRIADIFKKAQGHAAARAPYSRTLGRRGSGPTCGLAGLVEQFVGQIPPARTNPEQIAAKILQHARTPALNDPSTR